MFFSPHTYYLWMGITILTDTRPQLFVVLIWISVFSDIEYFFIYLFTICGSSLWCVYKYRVCVWARLDVFMKGKDGCWVSSSVALHHICWGTVSFLSPEFTSLVGLVSWIVPGTPVSTFKFWGYRLASMPAQVLGSWTWILTLSW